MHTLLFTSCSSRCHWKMLSFLHEGSVVLVAVVAVHSLVCAASQNNLVQALANSVSAKTKCAQVYLNQYRLFSFAHASSMRLCMPASVSKKYSPMPPIVMKLYLCVESSFSSGAWLSHILAAALQLYGKLYSGDPAPHSTKRCLCPLLRETTPW